MAIDQEENEIENTVTTEEVPTKEDMNPGEVIITENDMPVDHDLNIIVNSPDRGSASQYIAHAVDVDLHAEFVQFLHDMPHGIWSEAKLQITHELMTLLRVPMNPEEYDRYSLLKLPHCVISQKRNQKVCALVRRENPSLNSCALRALMRVF